MKQRFMLLGMLARNLLIALALAFGLVVMGCKPASSSSPGGGGGLPPSTPSYSISLNQTESHTFPAATAGYEMQNAKGITITNTGNQATGALTVALSGDDSASFTLSTTAITSIAVGGTDPFTVRPNTGLAVGTYTATVTVSGENSITANFDVSFTVIPAVGTATVIYAWMNEHEIVTSDSTATLSRGANENLAITVTDNGYSNYQWVYNGIDIAPPLGTAASYTFDSAGRGNGKYYIGLRIKKDNVWYLTQITITVQD
jgi:hypothetical protein